MQSSASSSDNDDDQSSGEEEDESSPLSEGHQPTLPAAGTAEAADAGSESRSPSLNDQPIVDQSNLLPLDTQEMEKDKAAIYKHPLFPLVGEYSMAMAAFYLTLVLTILSQQWTGQLCCWRSASMLRLHYGCKRIRLQQQHHQDDRLLFHLMHSMPKFRHLFDPNRRKGKSYSLTTRNWIT